MTSAKEHSKTPRTRLRCTIEKLDAPTHKALLAGNFRDL